MAFISEKIATLCDKTAKKYIAVCRQMWFNRNHYDHRENEVKTMATKHTADVVDLLVQTRTASTVGDMDKERKALHEAIEIKCFYEGTSTLLVGTQTVQVSAGDIVIINPYEFHATVDRGKEGNPGKYHLFMVPLDYFSGSNINELNLRTIIFGQEKMLQTLFRQDAQLYGLLMDAVTEHIEKKIAWEARRYALLMEFFSLVVRKGYQEAETLSAPSSTLRVYRLIEPALRHMRDHYAESVSVDELAQYCRVSKHYFCRVFKMATGKTAIEYLQDYRMTVADTMLSNTDKSIAQIAADCGFESANYFGRCYKATYGITPGKRRT